MSSGKLLLIETSSPVCSVAISEQGELRALLELTGEANHAAMLTDLINRVLQHSNTEIQEPDAIVVSGGPGSYTGLRIGAATAKGLCFALDKPLIVVDSLQAMAYGMVDYLQDEQLIYCPTIDARRSEIYYGLYLHDGTVLKTPANLVLTGSFLHDRLAGNRILIGGSGVAKCKLLEHANQFEFDTHTSPSAKWMITPATEQFKRGAFTNPVLFEPNYIKPVFITSKKPAL